ncbi:MAG: EMC3/TMCO1 family protein [Candidatus Helarchaeota archaeon]
MDSKVKYIFFFIGLIIGVAAIFLIFPQLEFTVWYPLRSFLKYNLHLSFTIVTLFAMCLALVSNLVSYAALDLPRMKRYQKEIQKWKAQEQKVKKLKAAGTPNKKLALKVRRKKKYIEKIQREVASERMKPTLFTMVPFMIIFLILNGFVFPSASGIIVAIFPFNLYKIPLIGAMPYLGPINATTKLIPMFFKLPNIYLGGGITISPTNFFQSIYSCENGYYLYFTSWYFVGTFGFNSILQRVLGLNLEM